MQTRPPSQKGAHNDCRSLPCRGCREISQFVHKMLYMVVEERNQCTFCRAPVVEGCNGGTKASVYTVCCLSVANPTSTCRMYGSLRSKHRHNDTSARKHMYAHHPKQLTAISLAYPGCHWLNIEGSPSKTVSKRSQKYITVEQMRVLFMLEKLRVNLKVQIILTLLAIDRTRRSA